MFVNYSDCILNYISSIRNYYGLKTFYGENETLSKLLNTNKPKKVILVLIDAMGSRLIERKLSEDSFLRSHLLGETSSVFPPTTAAATTSILNGKSPNMHLWLGWTAYFKEVDNTITLLLNKGFYDKKDYGEGFVESIIPSDNMIDELNQKGIKATVIGPEFMMGPTYKKIEDFADLIVEESYSDSEFIYAYYGDYDSLLHKRGVRDKKGDELLRRINDSLKRASDNINKDTMMVIIADHGMVDIKPINLFNSKLKDYMIRPFAIEPRAAAFYIKEDKKEIFAKEFKELYEDDFILFSKDEVIKSHLFGDNKNHERFEEFIGDFIAVSKSDKLFIYKESDEDKFDMVASHAGSLIDELMVPVIVYSK